MSDNETVFTAATGTLSGWWRDTRVAAAFLTRLPITLKEDETAAEGSLAAAARAFPIAGLAVGLAAGGGLLLASWLGLHPLACALVGLAVAALVTGALHEDGLADTADGFGGGRTVSEKLQIMRDSRTGAYGVLALIFSVGLRATALAGLFSPATAAAVLAAAGAASRGVLPAVMYGLDAAREDGLAAGAGRPGKADAVIAAVLGGLLALLFLDFAAGIVALPAVAAAAAVVAWLARRQVGGHTGDVLGAVQQVSELALIVAVAAVLE